MTTKIGSLLAFLQSAWAATPGTDVIHFSEDWYDNHYTDNPQISISDLVSPKYWSAKTAGSLDCRFRPQFLVNCWHLIPHGGSGTVERDRIEIMRREVSRVFRANFNGTATTNYGGSLNIFSLVLPLDYGRPMFELKEEPQMLRYEIVLVGTCDNE